MEDWKMIFLVQGRDCFGYMFVFGDVLVYVFGKPQRKRSCARSLSTKSLVAGSPKC